MNFLSVLEIVFFYLSSRFTDDRGGNVKKQRENASEGHASGAEIRIDGKFAQYLALIFFSFFPSRL